MPGCEVFTESKKNPKHNPISPFGAASQVANLFPELRGGGIAKAALLRLRGEPGRVCRLTIRPARASYTSLRPQEGVVVAVRMPEIGKGSRGRATTWQFRRRKWTASMVLAVALVLAFVRRQMRFYRLLLRDPRTPTSSKILLGAALGYAIWPLGLVPDFIPIVGYVDDIVIVPALVCIAVRRVPDLVVDACRQRAIRQEAS